MKYIIKYKMFIAGVGMGLFGLSGKAVAMYYSGLMHPKAAQPSIWLWVMAVLGLIMWVYANYLEEKHG